MREIISYLIFGNSIGLGIYFILLGLAALWLADAMDMSCGERITWLWIITIAGVCLADYYS